MQENAGFLLRTYSDVRNRLNEQVIFEPSETILRVKSSHNATSLQWPYTIVMKS